MGSKTTYTCDDCGKVEETGGGFPKGWNAGIVGVGKDAYCYGVFWESKVDLTFCPECSAKFGIVPEGAPKDKQERESRLKSLLNKLSGK